MEGGDQWRVIRYDGGDAMQGNNKLPMLRFRPIAPKPASTEGDLLFNNNLLLNFKRTKRKYVRVRKNNNGYRRKKKISSTSTTTTTTTTTKNDLVDGQIMSTLQLLPEKKDLELPQAIISPLSSNLELDLTVSVDQTVTVTTDLGSETNMVYVTVESVTLTTDTCIMERVNNLVSDTCPGFVSDGENRVYWVNNAFKSLINVSNNDKEMIIVLLVMKDGLRPITSMKRDFTCKVKVEYTWQKEKCLKMVVPCDVWRLDDGGAFAWRLDIDAALSLGPLKSTVGGD
ncbi:hypothetical protein ACFE04_009424 [Oxalis oulophora]